MGVGSRAADRPRGQVAHQDLKIAAQIGREELVDGASLEHDFAAASGADDEGALAVLIGAAIFVLMMATDYWMSYGYWMVVLPPVGIVLERALRAFGASLREAAAQDRLPMAVPAPG